MRGAMAIAIGLAAAAMAAPAVAQVPVPGPAPAIADMDTARFEPGIEARRRRHGRPPRERVAMAPVHVLRFPFRVLNYPIENFVIQREPGIVTVYAKRFTGALGRQGIELQVRGTGAGSGYGAGIVYRAPERLSFGKPLHLSAITTHSGYDQFALTLDSLLAGAVDLGVRLHYAERPREDFFGLGPHSDFDDRATYQLDEWLAQVQASLPLGDRLRFFAQTGVTRTDIGRGRDPDFPTVLEVFDRATPGLAGRHEFLDWGVGVAFDTRDDRSYARAGSWLGARVGGGDGLRDTRSAYTKIEVEAQQFVRLWGERRSLAFRLRGVVTEDRSGADGDAIPVFRLERLGGSRSLRGYQSFRFTDKDALVGNFEYRFPIWNIEPPGLQALDGAALFDFGTAVPDLFALRQRDLRSAAGFGLRFATRGGLLGRLDSMWSPEGYRGHFGMRGTF